jgi:hypothetical protein
MTPFIVKLQGKTQNSIFMICLNLGSVRISGFYCLAELAQARKIQVFKWNGGSAVSSRDQGKSWA